MRHATPKIITRNDVMIDIKKYGLIGIGDFSHGDQNIWNFRFGLLKNVINATNRNVVIFTEDTEEHCSNIMNDKILTFEKNYDRYAFRIYDSPIYLEIIKYIRIHTQRIKLIGVDNEILARDKYMATKILKNLDEQSINFFWAHNDHVDNRKITELYETAWHDEKYYAGHYLKKKLLDKYCIILSTGYKGILRFDGKCNDEKCTERTTFNVPKFKKFIVPKYENYESGLYENFNNDIAEFAATTFPNNLFMKKTKPNYVIFFRNVSPLLLGLVIQMLH